MTEQRLYLTPDEYRHLRRISSPECEYEKDFDVWCLSRFDRLIFSDNGRHYVEVEDDVDAVQFKLALGS